MKALAVCLWFLILAAGSLCPAQAASDNTLRAVYCISIIDSQIKFLSAPPPELPGTPPELVKRGKYEQRKAVQMLLTNRERLRVYGISHIAPDGSDLLAIATAKKRGEIDAAACEREM